MSTIARARQVRDLETALRRVVEREFPDVRELSVEVTEDAEGQPALLAVLGLSTPPEEWSADLWFQLSQRFNREAVALDLPERLRVRMLTEDDFKQYKAGALGPDVDESDGEFPEPPPGPDLFDDAE